MSGIEALRRRLAVAEKRTRHPGERLSDEQLGGLVEAAIRKLEAEILPSGVRFIDGTEVEQQAFCAAWLREYGDPDRFDVEFELRRYFSTLRKVRCL